MSGWSLSRNQSWQQIILQKPITNRDNHLLLAYGAIKIAATCVTGTRISQGIFTRQGLHTVLELELAFLIVHQINLDFLGDINLYSANLIDETYERMEIDLGVILDGNTQEVRSCNTRSLER